MDTIEIPFGAKDFETLGRTFIIQEGFTAKIEDGKIIVKKEETEDERIRTFLYHTFTAQYLCKDKTGKWHGEPVTNILAYLEKQKELFESGRGLYYYDGEKTTYCGYPVTEEKPYDFAISQQEKQKESLHIEKTCKDNADFTDGIIEVRSFQRGMEEGRRLEKQKEQELSTPEDIAAAYQQGLATGRKEQKSVNVKFIEDTISYLNGGMCFSNSMEELKYRSNLAYGLRSLRPPQDRCKDCPHRGDMFLLTQGFKSGKHELAIRFMNYLDENRPEDKMGLSNSECEDIDKAFNENDWNKIIRYIEKYKPHWKPSEEQMDSLRDTIVQTKGYSYSTYLPELYEQLKKRM